jgi:transposase-like protein
MRLPFSSHPSMSQPDSEVKTPSLAANPTCGPTASRTNSASYIRHSILRTRQGRIPRWRCKRCGRTFTLRTGTAYHRLRSAPARFDRVVQMSVEGMSKASAARVSYVCSATVGRWLERAARTAALLTDRALRDVKATELQGDELRGYARDKGEARVRLRDVRGRRPDLAEHGRSAAHAGRNTRLFVRGTAIAVRRTGAPLFVTDPLRIPARDRPHLGTCMRPARRIEQDDRRRQGEAPCAQQDHERRALAARAPYWKTCEDSTSRTRATSIGLKPVHPPLVAILHRRNVEPGLVRRSCASP